MDEHRDSIEILTDSWWFDLTLIAQPVCVSFLYILSESGLVSFLVTNKSRKGIVQLFSNFWKRLVKMEVIAIEQYWKRKRETVEIWKARTLAESEFKPSR